MLNVKILVKKVIEPASKYLSFQVFDSGADFINNWNIEDFVFLFFV